MKHYYGEDWQDILAEEANDPEEEEELAYEESAALLSRISSSWQPHLPV